MKISRRDFLKSGFTSLLAGVALYGDTFAQLRHILSPGGGQLPAPTTSPSEAHYWRFVVDITRCIGCGKCVRACKMENNVPFEPEYNRTWIERYVITDTEQVLVDSPNAGIDGFSAEHMNLKYRNLDIRKSFFVPKLCNQCDSPPCVPVCPVGATYITEEGVVLVNRQACIGCRYCVQACPYGARFFNHRLKVVDKCTWCYHRITRGLLPACVEVCPVGARAFGDIRNPESLVSRLIGEHTIGILKPETGCQNKVYYIGLEKGVR